MMIRFGYALDRPVAWVADDKWDGVTGFLMDVRPERETDDALTRLRRAKAGHSPADFGWDAFWLESDGTWAILTCTACDLVPVVRIGCDALIDLLVAWSSFIQTGEPTSWDVPDQAKKE